MDVNVKRFPCHWSFVRLIYRSLIDHHYKDTTIQSFDLFRCWPEPAIEQAVELQMGLTIWRHWNVIRGVHGEYRHLSWSPGPLLRRQKKLSTTRSRDVSELRCCMLWCGAFSPRLTHQCGGGLGVGVGVWTPYLRSSTTLPPPNFFLPYPRPPPPPHFSLFFFGYPRPKFRFLTFVPAHLTLPPPAHFSSKAPYPRPHNTHSPTPTHPCPPPRK